VSNVLARLSFSVCVVVVDVYERRRSSVTRPGPHSHPAAVERGGKDINRTSGIRAQSEE